jgi:hypothetical protein
MHLLYLDESGSVADPNQTYFVLAGICVYERAAHWIEEDLNAIARRFEPSDPYSVELHGSPMRSGRDGWKERAPLQARIDAIKDALSVGVNKRRYPRDTRLFGAVVKKAALAGSDPVEHAFEQLCNRFDLFLRRLYAKHNDPQRGIILFDKSTTEQRIQTLAREFKSAGHSWGKTKNYAEVPVFLDSRASRLIQLADLIAYALYRFHEANDNEYYRVINRCFDAEGLVEHGLYVRS